MPAPQLLNPEDRVLSTLDHTGKRRWMNPRLAKGRFLRARRFTAYALIVIFTALPYIRINGKPAMFLDVLRREFTFFGKTFLPTDGFLLALFMVGLLLTVFFATALLGRVWCGWACPQTVYLEFIYRPVERLFHGTAGTSGGGGGGKPRKEVAGWKLAAKYAVYLLISMFLAHTFLAYFVGVENLARWVTGSPIDHPVAFLVMTGTTALMMFDFCYWREQLCIIGCPYGRFQSVMLDRQSLIISYDPRRGEPRGKLSKKTPSPEESTTKGRISGDCIDCTLCVQACPTGIDIRNGLQLECINCAQCIDACDTVMDKIGKPRGLIRYSSQQTIEASEGEHTPFLRPRVIIYPLLILAIVGLFFAVLSTKSVASTALLRGRGIPYYDAGDGRIANTMQLEIVNRSDDPRAFTIALADSPDFIINVANNPLRLTPGQRVVEPIQIIAPHSAFTGGVAYTVLRITDGQGYQHTIHARLLGPMGPGGMEK